MSKYAKQQEYRVKAELERLGCTVIWYYGSRELRKGDFLIERKGKRFRIDHKSTADTASIRFQFDWLDKLNGENMKMADKEGLSTPFISFTIKGHHQIYAVSDFNPNERRLMYSGAVIKTKSVVLVKEELVKMIDTNRRGLAVSRDLGNNEYRTIYVMWLETFLNLATMEE